MEGSTVNAHSTSSVGGAIFSGCSNRNLWVTKGSFIEAPHGDFSGSTGELNVFISRDRSPI